MKNEYEFEIKGWGCVILKPHHPFLQKLREKIIEFKKSGEAYLTYLVDRGGPSWQEVKGNTRIIHSMETRLTITKIGFRMEGKGQLDSNLVKSTPFCPWETFDALNFEEVNGLSYIKGSLPRYMDEQSEGPMEIPYGILQKCKIAYTRDQNNAIVRRTTFDDIGALVYSRTRKEGYSEWHFSVAVPTKYRYRGVAKTLVLDLIEEAVATADAMEKDIVISFSYAGRPWGLRMFKELGFEATEDHNTYQVRINA